jgi:hypothetical protein
MLPFLHQGQYKAFQQALSNLVANFDSLERLVLAEEITHLQTLYQQQIMLLLSLEEEPELSYQIQSYGTEIHKQLQLLKMDAAFLQAARRPETIAQRQNQIRDRLNLLIGYCTHLLREDKELTDPQD